MAKAKAKKPELDADSQAFYDKIMTEYRLTTAGCEVLKVACATLTRWRQAKALLDVEGLILPGNLQRVHPAAKIEHDSRLSFARYLKELGLDEGLQSE